MVKNIGNLHRLKGNKMDLEEVYLRQIVEQLKLQNKLKEDNIKVVIRIFLKLTLDTLNFTT